ncbi:MAG: hypothetical protein QOE64_721 [Frankiales bacterium]|nr:hypothetical protein [Frankiales bacterium]
MFQSRWRIGTVSATEEAIVKRLVAAVFTLAVVLGLPATAAAKGPIDSLKVCGKAGCAAVPLDKQHGGPISMDVFFGSYEAQSLDDPLPGPFYEVKVQTGGGVETWFVVPGVDAVGSDGVWQALPRDVAGRIADAARGIKPYDFHITAVYVDKRTIKNSGAFIPLFRLPPGHLLASEAYKHSSQWLTIDVATSRTTPWGSLHTYYDPVLRAASVNSHQWTALPDAMADRVDATLGIASASPQQPGDSGSSMLPWAGAALAALAAVVALLAFARRRRGRPRPAPIA